MMMAKALFGGVRRHDQGGYCQLRTSKFGESPDGRMFVAFDDFAWVEVHDQEVPAFLSVSLARIVRNNIRSCTGPGTYTKNAVLRGSP